MSVAAIDPRIPVTVLTGYLGAGKTTLLNRILREEHGRRYAVVVNEFGETGIDAGLVVGADEELFEMNNGCVCCTVRGDLIRTLHQLLGRDSARFDAIIVETTGLADPGPVAQTFMVDPLLRARTVLDSVTTLVDARHIGLRLADSAEAAAQIAFADQIVLNKVDLVQPQELLWTEALLRRLNPMAPVHRAERAEVALERIIGVGGFDLARMEAMLAPHDGPAHGEPGHVHGPHCAQSHDGDGLSGGHIERSGISSLSLHAHAPLDQDALERWLTDLLAQHGAQLLRTKGIVALAGEPRRLVIQAVHMLLDAELQRAWAPGEARHSRLVFIGRHLDAQALQRGFAACVATQAAH